MIGFYFAYYLTRQRHFTCSSVLHVQFDKVLESLEVMSEFCRLGLDVQDLYIVTGLAITATVRTPEGWFDFIGQEELGSRF